MLICGAICLGTPSPMVGFCVIHHRSMHAARPIRAIDSNPGRALRVRTFVFPSPSSSGKGTLSAAVTTSAPSSTTTVMRGRSAVGPQVS